MALRFLSEQGSQNRDLPWVNEYLKTEGKVGDASLVDSYISLDDKYL